MFDLPLTALPLLWSGVREIVPEEGSRMAIFIFSALVLGIGALFVKVRRQRKRREMSYAGGR
jgi:hypothetical protein